MNNALPVFVDDFKAGSWFVVFKARSDDYPWLNRLPIGRFKHVFAVCKAPGSDAWVIYNPGPWRQHIWIVPDRHFAEVLGMALEDCDEVLKSAAGAPRSRAGRRSIAL